MAEDWENWVRQRKKEGFSRDEVKEYVEQQGYDPSVVDRYWGQSATTDTREVDREREQELMSEPRDDDGEDMRRAELDEEQRRRLERGNVPPPITDALSPGTVTNTALNMLSSPAGYFRRGSLAVVDAVVFTVAVAVVSFILSVVAGVATGAISGALLGGGGRSIVAAATAAGERIGIFLVFGLAVTVYYSAMLAVLGGRGGPRETLVIVLYSSVQLLLSWLPFPLGLVSWPAGFYVQYFGLREIHNSSGIATLTVMALPYLVVLGLFLRQVMAVLGAAV